MSFCNCINPKKSEARLKSKMIDKLLKRDKKEFQKQIKLLLLGPGESGKSTFMKQMKIINGINFDLREVEDYRLIIYSNIIRGTNILIYLGEKLNVRFNIPKNVMAQFSDFEIINCQIFQSLKSYVLEVWQNEVITKILERQNDCLFYYKNHLQRIADENFIPNVEDILHCRKATKNIVEHVINIHGQNFRFVDVGGQRSQRQKWVQCFEGVTSIIFIIDSSSIFTTVLEKNSTDESSLANKLLHTTTQKNQFNFDRTNHKGIAFSNLGEAQAIFDTIVNNRFFTDVSIILFLNKTDLLRKKFAERYYNTDEINNLNLSSSLNSDQNNISSSNVEKGTQLNKMHLLPLGTTLPLYNDYLLPDADEFLGNNKNHHQISPPNYDNNKSLIFERDFAHLKSQLLILFDSVRRNRERPLFHHFTTAIDSKNIERVFNDVKGAILERHIKDLHLT